MKYCLTGRWFWKHLQDNLPCFQCGKAWRDNWGWKDSAGRIELMSLQILSRKSPCHHKASSYYHEPIGYWKKGIPIFQKLHFSTLSNHDCLVPRHHCESSAKSRFQGEGCLMSNFFSASGPLATTPWTLCCNQERMAGDKATLQMCYFKSVNN